MEHDIIIVSCYLSYMEYEARPVADLWGEVATWRSM